MSTSTLLPLSGFLTTSYRPNRDWIEGELKQRNMGVEEFVVPDSAIKISVPEIFGELAEVEAGQP